jgi:hypothetical protein
MHEAVWGGSGAAELADEHDDALIERSTALVENHDGDIRPGYNYFIGFDTILGRYVDLDVQRPVDEGLLTHPSAECPDQARAD